MRHTVALLTTVSLAIASATTSQIAAPAERYNPKHYSGGDGLAQESAVVINLKRDLDATKAIYVWLAQHHPGGKRKGVSTIPANGHMYDVVEIVSSDGTVQKYWFDITRSFGKHSMW